MACFSVLWGILTLVQGSFPIQEWGILTVKRESFTLHTGLTNSQEEHVELPPVRYRRYDSSHDRLVVSVR